jgi:DNA-binding NarL/FixJ family response regulator
LGIVSVSILDRFRRSPRRRWPDPSIDEIRKRARIVVIDDQEFPYAKLFARDGYTLQKWDDVTNLSDLEDGDYDLILLDLQGVGKAESAKEEGLGILRHLRTRRPAQIIIAYSNADWPLSNQPFFRMADATLPKSADYVDFKQKVDELLQRRFSIGFYVERIQAQLQDHSQELPNLEKTSRDAILLGRTDVLAKYLRGRVNDPAAIDRALQVATVAVGIATLIWQK